MLVKELMELLSTLPEDAHVIVSEKFGRGGHLQSYCIGTLKNDSYVKGKRSDLLQTLKHFEEHKFRCDLGIDELTAGTAYREEYVDQWGREVAVWKAKDGTPFQYFRKGDEWDKDQMIKIFKFNSKEDMQHIKDIKKQMKPPKNVNAIELSCDF